MSMNWKVSTAKQEFSRVVEQASREIQWILNRDTPVAAIISAAEAQAFLEWKEQAKKQKLDARLARLTQICAESDYTFEAPAREDRATDFGIE
jgi:prevent-host-death family protein